MSLSVAGPVLIALLAAQGAQAPEPRPPGQQVDVSDAALLRAVRGIAEQVEALRGERFGTPVEVVRTPQELLDVAAELRAYSAVGRDRLAARGRAWSDIGFGVPTAPDALYRLLAQDLPGIGFDAVASRLLVAPDRLTENDFTAHDAESPIGALLLAGVRPDAPLVAHMLTHVRQRERAGRDPWAETTDELLARAAWAEGEANLVAMRYLFSGLSLQDEALDASLDPGQFLGGALVPEAARGVSGVEVDLLRFVYEEGYAQAVERYRKDGWPRVAADMARDTTTRQVLHPGAAPLDAAFGDPVPPFAGLRLADRDALGEQGIITFVSRLTGKDNLALQAGEGWAGDQLLRWESAEGAVTEWVTRWASDEDVDDFDYALGRALAVRFPGREPAPAGGGVRILRTDERVFRLERSGRTIRLSVATSDLGRAWTVAPPAGAGGAG